MATNNPALTADRAYYLSRTAFGTDPDKYLTNLYKSGGSEADAYKYIYSKGFAKPGQTLNFLQGLGFDTDATLLAKQRAAMNAAYNSFFPKNGQSTVAPSNPQEALQQRSTQTAQAIRDQEAKRAAFNASQTATGEASIKQLEDAIAAQPSLASQREAIANELGLPQLRGASTALNQSIIDLQQTLYNLPKNVESRTRGFDVNASRLAQIKEAESQPIRNDIANLGYNASYVGQALSGAEKELSDRLSMAVDERNLNLLPAQQRVNIVQQQLAREATGFNNQMQNELQLLRDKLDAGERLSENQANRMFQLETLESQFNNALKLQQQQQTFEAGQPQRTVVNTANGQLLIDSVTGEVIKNLGPAASTGGSGSNIGDILKYLNLGGETGQTPTQPTSTEPKMIDTPLGKLTEEEYADYIIFKNQMGTTESPTGSVENDVVLDSMNNSLSKYGLNPNSFGLGSSLSGFNYNPLSAGMFGIK